MSIKEAASITVAPIVEEKAPKETEEFFPKGAIAFFVSLLIGFGLIFVLDPSLRWRFTIAGVNWSPQELARAIGLVRSPGFMTWMTTHPDAVAWTGFSSVLLSVALLAFWLIWYKPQEQAAQ